MSLGKNLAVMTANFVLSSEPPGDPVGVGRVPSSTAALQGDPPFPIFTTNLEVGVVP